MHQIVTTMDDNKMNNKCFAWMKWQKRFESAGSERERESANTFDCDLRFAIWHARETWRHHQQISLSFTHAFGSDDNSLSLWLCTWLLVIRINMQHQHQHTKCNQESKQTMNTTTDNKAQTARTNRFSSFEFVFVLIEQWWCVFFLKPQL